MAIYCIKIKYTKEAIKGMMEEGVDRADAMRNLSEALGGKLLGAGGAGPIFPAEEGFAGRPGYDEEEEEQQ